MLELFVIDRINENIVCIQNINTKSMYNINKSKIIGECKESNIYVKKGDIFEYSINETNKRKKYIEDLTKNLWK